MKKILFIILTCIACDVFAQSAQEVLSACTNAFRDNKYLSMEVAVYNYANSTSSGELLGRAIMRKSDNNYYSKFLNDEMISNKNCTVILNHESKTMRCFVGQNQKHNQVAATPDSVLLPGDSLVYNGIENNERHVTIYHKNSYYLRTEMYFSVATSLPSRIIYYHAPANEEFTTDAYKTELLYEKISFEKTDEDIFSEKKYVERKNGKWIAAPEFKNYVLTVSETPEQ